MSLENMDQINAMGNITEQTTRQRSGRGLNIVPSNSPSNPLSNSRNVSVFSVNRPLDDEIKSTAFNMMNQLYTEGTNITNYTGSARFNNPDFGSSSLNADGNKSGDNLNFISPINRMRDNTDDNVNPNNLSLENSKGPNLIVGNIDSQGTPLYVPVPLITNNNINITHINNDRGYGVSDVRSETYVATTYLQRKFDSNADNDPTLGDYLK